MNARLDKLTTMVEKLLECRNPMSTGVIIEPEPPVSAGPPPPGLNQERRPLTENLSLPTPIKTAWLGKMLESFHDGDYIVSGFKKGFDLGYQGP